MNKKYFGDKETFAIRYVPEFKSTYQGHTWYYAYLHLQLGGQIIGTIEESCSAPNWTYKAALLLDRLTNHFDKFSHPEFLNRTDQEIFELVWKSNQLDTEFDPQYAYLPQLDNNVWVYCGLGLGETIDAYLITITAFDNVIKFIWKGWRDPCPKHEIGILNSVSVDKDVVIETLDQCIKYVDKDLRNYKERR